MGRFITLFALATVVVGLDVPELPETCDDDCALSLRQLRGQQFEAKVGKHGEGSVEDLEDTPEGEGTEDPYSKAPDTAADSKPAEAPAAEEPAAKAPATEAPAEAPATEAPAEAPAAKAPAEEAPAEAPATEAPAEAPAAEAPAAKAPAEEAPAEAPATEAPAEAPAAEEPAAKAPTEEAPAEDTTADSTPAADSAEEEPAAEASADDEESTMTQEKWESEKGGLCCFSGEDYHDTCGSCYPTAIASFKSPCATGADKCGTCGGSWCQPKCVMGAADPNNKCATAFDTGIAESKSFCAANSTSCASCKGEWCRLGVTKVAGGAGVVNGKTEAASSQNAAATGGFCCYRGKSFAKDMCGACADVSQDIACANSKGCGSCGGTWCAGPRCVKAFSDKSNPCGSAYHDSVAAKSDYCAGSERRCTDCAGAWCSASNITFDSGEKFNPDASEEEETVSEESSDDEDTEDTEDTEENPSFEPLDDLLPNGNLSI